MGEAVFCVVCGQRARGFATIAGDRVCHGDDDESPTCYETAQWEVAWQTPWRWENAKICWALERARAHHPSGGH
jgi:hypothetical protein